MSPEQTSPEQPNEDREDVGLFTDGEGLELLSRFVEGADPESMDQDEIVRLFEWAEGARIEQAMLEGVHTGRFVVRWPEGQDEPTFASTGRGRS
jgi:hypothetical protein